MLSTEEFVPSSEWSAEMTEDQLSVRAKHGMSGTGVRRFQDLIAWQRARRLVTEVYSATRHGVIAEDRGLCWQLQRAAVSIMSNIAEGFERGTPREFHNFLRIAKGSAAELRSLLIVASDVNYLSDAEHRRLDLIADETSRVIGGLRRTVAERARSTPRAGRLRGSGTQHSALSTQHSPGVSL